MKLALLCPSHSLVESLFHMSYSFIFGTHHGEVPEIVSCLMKLADNHQFFVRKVTGNNSHIGISINLYNRRGKSCQCSHQNLSKGFWCPSFKRCVFFSVKQDKSTQKQGKITHNTNIKQQHRHNLANTVHNTGLQEQYITMISSLLAVGKLVRFC